MHINENPKIKPLMLAINMFIISILIIGVGYSMQRNEWNSKSNSTELEFEPEDEFSFIYDDEQPDEFTYIVDKVNNGQDLEPSDIANLLEKYTTPLDECLSHLEPLKNRLLLDLLNSDVKFDKKS